MAAHVRSPASAAAGLLRARAPRPSFSWAAANNASQRRLAHRRVPLPYDAEHGLPGFLSPNALRTVAVDWQEGVLARLDELVRGTDLEDKSVLQTLKEAAQDPTRTLAFNYASEALNNSFFLSTLSPTASSGPTPSSSFSTKLSQTPSLGSFPALVSHFSAHVSGLHPSSGAYVWLVTDPAGNLGVVGTYAGGTVLVKERAQTGYGSYAGKDLRVLGEQVEVVDEAPEAAAAAEGAESKGQEQPDEQPAMAWKTVTPARPAGSSAATNAGGMDISASAQEIMSAARSSSSVEAAAVGASLHPLACISVHPHCYLEDYGLWGRDEYVRRWWSKVDWAKVEQAYDAFTTRARATR